MSIREIELPAPTASIEWEDLQRIERGPYFAVTKLAAKKKVLTLHTEDGSTIQFQRGIRMKGIDDFTITVRKTVSVTQKCSLGHHHVTARNEIDFVFAHMEWAHAEALAEWIRSGSWSQVRNGGAT